MLIDAEAIQRMRAMAHELTRTMGPLRYVDLMCSCGRRIIDHDKPCLTGKFSVFTLKTRAADDE